MEETITKERPWECEDCGMIHSHFRGEMHDLRAMGGSPFFPDLKYNAECHCGWHEMVALMDEGVVDAHPALEAYVRHATKQLPIPSAVEEDLSDTESK